MLKVALLPRVTAWLSGCVTIDGGPITGTSTKSAPQMFPQLPELDVPVEKLAFVEMKPVLVTASVYCEAEGTLAKA